MWYVVTKLEIVCCTMWEFICCYEIGIVCFTMWEVVCCYEVGNSMLYDVRNRMLLRNWKSYVLWCGMWHVVTKLEIVCCTMWEIVCCTMWEVVWCCYIGNHILHDVGSCMMLLYWKSYVVQCGKSYVVVKTKLLLRFWHKVVIWESVKKWQFCIGICYSVVHIDSLIRNHTKLSFGLRFTVDTVFVPRGMCYGFDTMW